MKSTSRRFYALVILALLLIAAVRTLRLDGLGMNNDETWHIWQSFGTPQQIIAWSPYDWPPLYPLLLGGWRLLVGLHPFVMHMLSVLLSLIGVAFAYQAGRLIAGRWAGLIGLLLYSGFAYSTFLSGYVRPYALAQPLVPLGFYLTLRYFAPLRRPVTAVPASGRRFRRGADWRRGLALVLVLSTSFYTTLVAPLWIAAYGFYTLVVYPPGRALRRWLPIAFGFGVLVAPLVLHWSWVYSGYKPHPVRPALLDGFSTIWWDFAGDTRWLLLALLLVALAGGLLARRRAPVRPLLGLALWGFGGLLALYVLHPTLGFFYAQYAFWVLPALALFGGVLLAQLPSLGRIGVAVGLAALVFVPVPNRLEQNDGHPGAINFAWLRDHYQAGDVLVLDPGFDCLDLYELDYFTQAFFPGGLEITRTIPDARRIWYASNDNTRDPAFAAQVAANRAASIAVGPKKCTFRLYEAPPNVAGSAFANGMRLHGGEMVMQQADQAVSRLAVAREGETITIRLWWSIDAAPLADYSVGVYVFDQSGQLLAQTDGPPQVDPPETSRWQLGQYYLDERQITLPYPLPTGTYRVALAVYEWWGDHQRIASPDADSDQLLTLFDLAIKSW